MQSDDASAVQAEIGKQSQRSSPGPTTALGQSTSPSDPGRARPFNCAGSGLVHATATRDSKDPSRVIMFVVFESEEKAWERKNDPRRQDGLTKAGATMMEIFEALRSSQTSRSSTTGRC